MAIKISNIFLSIVLAFSVMTPIVIELFPGGEDSVVFLDAEEESKNENKKELEVKNLFFEVVEIANKLDSKLVEANSFFLKFKIISFSIEVISPPPENNLFA